MTDEEKPSPEVHSLRFECYLTSTELNFPNLLGLVKTAVWEFITRETKMEFSEWTLVDLDDTLKGNMPIADFKR